MIVLLDPGHGKETPGKRSPDGRLLEYHYNRELAALIMFGLKRNGIDARCIVTDEYDVPLSERIRRVNDICSKEGKSNVLLVSIHCNAAGDGSKWINATGWECYTSPGKTKSDKLATYVYTEADKYLPECYKIRVDWSDGDIDKEARFYMLTQSKCAAILTENLFMDCKSDVEYMLSTKGIVTLANIHIDGITNYLKYE